MPRPRSTYTAELKLAAVKMIAGQKLSVAEAVHRLNVGENILRGKNGPRFFAAGLRLRCRKGQ